MATINELKWATLTATVNEMKSPNRFLQRLLFPNRVTLPTEDIEIGKLHKGREIAPFVRKNGEGIMVAGHTETFETVSAANIRIKRPFTPSELLYGRRPGTVIFSPGASYQMNAIRQHIARDMQVMADYITNAEEYLASMALQGVITYALADSEVFQIDFQRAAGNAYALSGADLWTASTAKPLRDIHGVKRILQDHGVQPTDCILGTEAADALLARAEAGDITLLGQNASDISAGEMSFLSQFDEDGVIYLGRLGGVRFWEYGRTATHPDGTTTVNMVRPKFAEFISRNAASERVMYYGAIPDMALFRGRLFQTRRFSKSWENEDPSAMMALVHTRPLPVLRRPDTTVSVQVVA